MKQIIKIYNTNKSNFRDVNVFQTNIKFKHEYINQTTIFSFERLKKFKAGEISVHKLLLYNSSFVYH